MPFSSLTAPKNILSSLTFPFGPDRVLPHQAALKLEQQRCAALCKRRPEEATSMVEACRANLDAMDI
jgi:hypothetical protein